MCSVHQMIGDTVHILKKKSYLKQVKLLTIDLFVSGLFS